MKEEGYDVIGVTMQIWQEESPRRSRRKKGGCCGLSAVEDARRVAAALGYPLLCHEFPAGIPGAGDRLFCAGEYLRRGVRPNPCIACNRYVKWEALLSNRSRAIGADYIATGHYAQASTAGQWKTETLAQPASGGEKDQTYALYSLTQEQLSADPDAGGRL